MINELQEDIFPNIKNINIKYIIKEFTKSGYLKTINIVSNG